MNRAGTAPPDGGAQEFAAVRPVAPRALTPGAGGSAGLIGRPHVVPPRALPASFTEHQLDRARAEKKLIARVFDRCHGEILAACHSSSVPPEFLGALTANETGGNNAAARFEPAVYRHLAAVAAGESPAYGSIHPGDLLAKLGRVVHPKADDFHAHFLTPAFGANHRGRLTGGEDEGLRELATSWGYTQIMGYHMVERRGTVRDLLDPAIHFRVALELLAEFAAAHQLDLASEFAEMFCCWNTGQPYAKCYDPHYVENGLARLAGYRELASAEKAKG